jgi:hypothetical protein
MHLLIFRKHLDRDPKSGVSLPPSRLDAEGRYGQSSRNVRRDAMDAGGVACAWCARTNDADADGEVVWSCRPDAGDKLR